MNYLHGKRVYLSAPIENITKDGLELFNNWASRLKVFLNNLGVIIFDPTTDPKQQWAPILKEKRESCDYDGMHEISFKFVRKDLQLVGHSDFLIAYLPYKVPTTGCTHEIILSNDNKNPTILFCPQGKQFISYWYYGFINHKYMFGEQDKLFKYLQDVNDGLYKNDDRWWFAYDLI